VVAMHQHGLKSTTSDREPDAQDRSEQREMERLGLRFGSYVLPVSLTSK
jgi:hypothetical protein